MEMNALKILAIDTSSKVSGVAIISEEKILAEFNTNNSLTHSQTIMPMVKAALDCSNIDISEIDVMAACVGPGSFTGLRIGISAIKGMAFLKNLPCVGVSTLKALAYNLIEYNGVVCAIMDARCNQVYTACFEKGKRITDDQAISIEQLEQQLSEINSKIILVGDGAKMHYNRLKESIKNLEIADSHNVLNRAASVALAAIDSYNNGEINTLDELLPNYLRLAQAERQRLEKGEKA